MPQFSFNRLAGLPKPLFQHLAKAKCSAMKSSDIWPKTKPVGYKIHQNHILGKDLQPNVDI